MKDFPASVLSVCEFSPHHCYSLSFLLSRRPHYILPRCVRRAIYVIQLWRPSSYKNLICQRSCLHLQCQIGRLSHCALTASKAVQLSIAVLRLYSCVASYLSWIIAVCACLRNLILPLSPADGHATTQIPISLTERGCSIDSTCIPPASHFIETSMGFNVDNANSHSQSVKQSDNSATYSHVPYPSEDVSIQTHTHLSVNYQPLPTTNVSRDAATTSYTLPGLSYSKNSSHSSITIPSLKCNTVSNSHASSISCGLMNSRSICNKSEAILEFASSHNLQMLAITEAWLTDKPEYDTMVIHA
jgi:hypothetical protein